MPTYDYICNSCGNAWEQEQRIVEDPIKQCPKCGQQTAKRQISAGAGFILKGGGWYADLYGSSKPSGGSPKDDDKASKSEAKDAKSDKSETKTDGAKSEGSKESSGSGSTPTDKGTTPSGGGSGETKAA
ncbi:MAG TPA: zinc ribbon domain-containing protein [Polyangiaceae bacterium]|jgi:putative FmdB family regulatory protein